MREWATALGAGVRVHRPPQRAARQEGAGTVVPQAPVILGRQREALRCGTVGACDARDVALGGHADVVRDLSARLAQGWDGAEVTRMARESVERCQVIMEAESVYLGAAPMAMGLADESPATAPPNS